MDFFKKENISVVFNLISLVLLVLIKSFDFSNTFVYGILSIISLGLFISAVYYLKYAKCRVLNLLVSLIFLYQGVFYTLAGFITLVNHNSL